MSEEIKGGRTAPYRVRAGYTVIRLEMRSSYGSLPVIMLRAFGPFNKLTDAQIYHDKQRTVEQDVEWTIIDLEGVK